MNELKYNKVLELCLEKYSITLSRINKLKKSSVVKEYLNLKYKITMLTLSYNHIKNEYYDNKDNIDLLIILKKQVDDYIVKCHIINEKLEMLESTSIIKEYNSLNDMLKLLDKIMDKLDSNRLKKILDVDFVIK